eukprot:6188361-Pleurochrysis_carterae.AAC.1
MCHCEPSTPLKALPLCGANTKLSALAFITTHALNFVLVHSQYCDCSNSNQRGIKVYVAQTKVRFEEADHLIMHVYGGSNGHLKVVNGGCKSPLTPLSKPSRYAVSTSNFLMHSFARQLTAQSSLKMGDRAAGPKFGECAWSHVRRHSHHVDHFVFPLCQVAPRRQLGFADLHVHSVSFEVLHLCPRGIAPVMGVVAFHGLHPDVGMSLQCTLSPIAMPTDSIAILSQCEGVLECVIAPVVFTLPPCVANYGSWRQQRNKCVGEGGVHLGGVQLRRSNANFSANKGLSSERNSSLAMSCIVEHKWSVGICHEVRCNDCRGCTSALEYSVCDGSFVEGDCLNYRLSPSALRLGTAFVLLHRGLCCP